MEKVRATIFRFDPSLDKDPWYERFEVPFEKDMRILDVLIAIGDDLGKSVAHRWYCGVKRCGACSATVNGKPVSVCWEPAEREMLIEPLPGFPIIKDLVVDRNGAEKVLASLRRFLVRKESPVFPEAIQHKDMIHVYKLVECIECQLCNVMCPVLNLKSDEFLGPMGLVQLAKYVLDPRDSLDRTQEIIESGPQNCVSCFACDDICPSGIKPVEDAITPLRLKLLKEGTGPERKHLENFEKTVKEDGLITPARLFLKDKGIAALLSLPLAVKMGFKGKIPLKTKPDVPSIQEIHTIVRYLGEENG